MKIRKLKQYFTTRNQCFIPKCKSHCCINVPLPEDFLPRFKNHIQRPVYSGINIGQNDPRDTFNSVIYNTTPNPIQLIGFDQNGNRLMGIPKPLMEQLQIKSMEQIQELVEKYKDFPNYCPFIQDNARCSVYSERPPICREFGTEPGKINECPDKSSRLEIAKFKIEYFIDTQKEVFKIMWQLITGKKQK